MAMQASQIRSYGVGDPTSFDSTLVYKCWGRGKLRETDNSILGDAQDNLE